MGKKYDLIKRVREILVSSSEKNEGELLATDLSYSCMELSTLKYVMGSDKDVEEQMREARKYLGEKPCYHWDDKGIRVWGDCVRDYNRLSKFYRNQGIGTEPIETYRNTPKLTPEILKLRILTKRTFRDVVRSGGKMSGLPEREIEKEILRQRLNP